MDPTLKGLQCGYKLFLKYGDLSFPSSQQFQPCHPDSCSNLVYGPFSLFSRSVVSNSLRPHGLQHTRPPCLSPAPGAYSNSCPLSRWCHPTISPSVIPFSSHLQSFPASGSFPMSPFFESGGQSIGASASASVLPMNIQGWFLLGLICLISLLSLKILPQHHSSKANFNEGVFVINVD